MHSHPPMKGTTRIQTQELSKGDLQPNDDVAPDWNAPTIAFMDEYELRIAQDKHASVRRMFHTLKKNPLKTVTRVRARECNAKVCTYIHVSNAITGARCQHDARWGS